MRAHIRSWYSNTEKYFNKREVMSVFENPEPISLNRCETAAYLAPKGSKNAGSSGRKECLTEVCKFKETMYLFLVLVSLQIRLPHQYYLPI